MTDYFLPKVGDKIRRVGNSNNRVTYGKTYQVSLIIDDDDYVGQVKDNRGTQYFCSFERGLWQIVDENFTPDKEYEDLYM